MIPILRWANQFKPTCSTYWGYSKFIQIAGGKVILRIFDYFSLHTIFKVVNVMDRWHYEHILVFFSFYFEWHKSSFQYIALNPLSANFTKWSNKLKQFVGKMKTCHSKSSENEPENVIESFSQQNSVCFSSLPFLLFLIFLVSRDALTAPTVSCCALRLPTFQLGNHFTQHKHNCLP